MGNRTFRVTITTPDGQDLWIGNVRAETEEQAIELAPAGAAEHARGATYVKAEEV